MSKTPSTRKRKKGRYARKKRSRMTPLIAGCMVILALMLGINALQESIQSRQAAATTVPTEGTLAANAYSAQDFTYENGYLACTAGEYSLGIDVSSHQSQIDWQQVAHSGMEFAFVRVGYRGYSEGILHTDELAEANLTGAREAGLDIGAYFFSQALTVEEAIEEAELCVDVLEGYELDLPVVFDWEYVSETARTASLDGETLTQCALAFCQTIEAAGFDAMIYSNASQARDLYQMTWLADYPFWLALYSDTMDYPYHIDVWQYTDQGIVPGIDEKVDINLMFFYE